MSKKSIKEQIKEYFLINPTIKLRVRQIERTINVPLPSVIRYTKELETEGILKINEIVNIKAYSANRSSESFKIEKTLHNLRQLHISNLISYLKEEYSNPTIIIFGSYSKGEDIEKSDIDLYIQTPSKKKITLSQFEKKLKRNIHTFIYKNINLIKNKDLANNIINGIVLNGFIEVLK